jgi:Ca2+-binding RTX toxin-like protein
MNLVGLNGGSGNNTFFVTGTLATTPLTINGGTGNNTLVGPDAPNTWTVTNPNAGMLRGDALPSPVTFSFMPNLEGGSDSDTFILNNGVGVNGTIDGGGGVNTLDYSAWTANVLVNLPLAVGTGAGGNIVNIQNIKGGSGGPAGSYNILVGNGGNVLTGGNGRRNLLVAGPSASTLRGGNDDDILIGGTTQYDLEAGLGSFIAIMNYWTGPDSYAVRVSRLLTGMGVPLLDATTVTGNGGGNVLLGGPGLDLFYGDLINDTYDWDPMSETFVPV